MGFKLKPTATLLNMAVSSEPVLEKEVGQPHRCGSAHLVGPVDSMSLLHVAQGLDGSIDHLIPDPAQVLRHQLWLALGIYVAEEEPQWQLLPIALDGSQPCLLGL